MQSTNTLRVGFLLQVVAICLPITLISLSPHPGVDYPTSYVHPVDDDRTIPLPYVTLRGTLIRHTFPGAPNYESVEAGDRPETRWVLQVSGSEIQHLINSGYLTEDLYDPNKEGWIQLIAAADEESPRPLLNKQIIVRGYLGTLISHIHTPATLEATEMHEDAEYMD